MKTELEKHPRTTPTWENQVWHARNIAKEKGLEALNNPHAMTGRICGCGSCFCCAALFVYNELAGKAVQP